MGYQEDETQKFDDVLAFCNSTYKQDGAYGVGAITVVLKSEYQDFENMKYYAQIRDRSLSRNLMQYISVFVATELYRVNGYKGTILTCLELIINQISGRAKCKSEMLSAFLEGIKDNQEECTGVKIEFLKKGRHENSTSTVKIDLGILKMIQSTLLEGIEDQVRQKRNNLNKTFDKIKKQEEYVSGENRRTPQKMNNDWEKHLERQNKYLGKKYVTF